MTKYEGSFFLCKVRFPKGLPFPSVSLKAVRFSSCSVFKFVRMFKSRLIDILNTSMEDTARVQAGVWN